MNFGFMFYYNVCLPWCHFYCHFFIGLFWSSAESLKPSVFFRESFELHKMLGKKEIKVDNMASSTSLLVIRSGSIITILPLRHRSSTITNMYFWCWNLRTALEALEPPPLWFHIQFVNERGVCVHQCVCVLYVAITFCAF